MRFSWLRCSRCLFFDPQSGKKENNLPDTVCRRVPGQKRINPQDWCAGWVCSRCYQPWRQVHFEYESSERTLGWEFWEIINHDICKELT